MRHWRAARRRTPAAAAAPAVTAPAGPRKQPLWAKALIAIALTALYAGLATLLIFKGVPWFQSELGAHYPELASDTWIVWGFVALLLFLMLLPILAVLFGKKAFKNAFAQSFGVFVFLSLIYIGIGAFMSLIFDPWLQEELEIDYRLVWAITVITTALALVIPFILFHPVKLPQPTGLKIAGGNITRLTIGLTSTIVLLHSPAYFTSDNRPRFMVAERESKIYWRNPEKCLSQPFCVSPLGEPLRTGTQEDAFADKAKDPTTEFKQWFAKEWHRQWAPTPHAPALAQASIPQYAVRLRPGEHLRVTPNLNNRTVLLPSEGFATIEPGDFCFHWEELTANPDYRGPVQSIVVRQGGNATDRYERALVQGAFDLMAKDHPRPITVSNVRWCRG